MAKPTHLTIELPQALGPAFIHVPLPLDAKARSWVDDQLERQQFFTRNEQMANFRAKLDWLPRTIEQLERSEQEYARGRCYHDACAIALGYQCCGCPECNPVRPGQEVA